MATSLALKTYVVCIAVLYLKFVCVTMIQARKTFDTGGRPPEDKRLPLAKGRRLQNYGLSSSSDGEEDKELKRARESQLRWRRIVANDLESIPLALIIFGGGVVADGDPYVQSGALVMYTALRCFHSYAYAKKLQPHRAWCWRLGAVSVLVGAVNALVGVWS